MSSCIYRNGMNRLAWPYSLLVDGGEESVTRQGIWEAHPRTPPSPGTSLNRPAVAPARSATNPKR